MLASPHRSILIGTLLLACLPSVAAAEGPRLTRFPTGTVHPGDVVELAWARPGDRVEELEILLSIDGGTRYTIRVSPELEASRGAWRWKVPHLAAAHAHLCVRYGEEGDEQLSAPSPEFRIEDAGAPTPGRAPDLRSAWTLRPGCATDWWDEADAAPAAASGPALSGEPALWAGGAAPEAIVIPRRSAPFLASIVMRPLAVEWTTVRLVARAVPPVTPEPRFVPRRE